MANRVVRFYESGGPEVLRLESAEVTTPGPGQIVVSVRAAGINPADLSFVAGSYGVKPSLPATPGWEAAGVVSALGAGVNTVEVGDAVLVALGAVGSQGAWRDFVTVSADYVFPVPPGLTIAQAGSLLIPYLTAWICIDRLRDVAPDGPLAIVGAGSAVGIAAGQIARLLGISCIGIVRRTLSEAERAGICCETVSVFEGGRFAQSGAEAGGQRPTMVIDCCAGEIGGATFRTMHPGGTHLVVGRLAGETLPVWSDALIFGEKRIEGFWLNRWLERAPEAERGSAYGALLGLLETGALNPPVDSEFDLADVEIACRRAMQPGKRGKVVLRMG